jgi:hypothetical protein
MTERCHEGDIGAPHPTSLSARNSDNAGLPWGTGPVR